MTLDAFHSQSKVPHSGKGEAAVATRETAPSLMEKCLTGLFTDCPCEKNIIWCASTGLTAGQQIRTRPADGNLDGVCHDQRGSFREQQSKQAVMQVPPAASEQERDDGNDKGGETLDNKEPTPTGQSCNTAHLEDAESNQAGESSGQDVACV